MHTNGSNAYEKHTKMESIMHRIWTSHEFECDRKGCSSPEDPLYPNVFVDNDNRDTEGAKEKAKKDGWKFVKRGGVRKIFCPTCFKEEHGKL